MVRKMSRAVSDPRLDRPLSLVAFACDVWLHRLLAHEALIPELARGTSLKAMLARITDDPDMIPKLEEGVAVLRDAATSLFPADEPRRDVEKVIDIAPSDSEKIRAFIRTLDDHLVRERTERAHLVSFYESHDIKSAAQHEWVDPSAFFSAWAAGPSRSKYEVLDRGRHAAAMATQLRDKLLTRLSVPANPSSPYEDAKPTLADLLRRTSRELIAVASLPPSSGAAAATRYLAAIGEIALEEIEEHLFGDRVDRGGEVTLRFGSVGAWRLPRVLTRIGELALGDLGEAVWGERRSPDIERRAVALLERLLGEETPNINRPRSLSVEAYRFLDAGAGVHGALYARLELGRTARWIDGEAHHFEPFGERGILSSREQAYTAFVVCERHGEDLARVLPLLRGPLQDEESFDGLHEVLYAARRYAAAYIEYLHQEGAMPPLAAFAFDASDPLFDAWRKIAEGGGSGEDVRTPVLAVWDALRSAADPHPTGTGSEDSAWSQERKHQRRVEGPHRTEADRQLAPVPMHARLATRSLVAQAVLSIDGTSRREAVEALRQAGLADVAAGLFKLVVEKCYALSLEAQADERARLNWLREQAVFLLSYTGSLVGFDALVETAGLTGGGTHPRWSAPPKELPDHERWIRTTALLGLADLGDALHDAEGDVAQARIDLLLDRIEPRLKQLSTRSVKVRSGGSKEVRGTDPRLKEQLWYVLGAERRSLVAILAMLRSADRRSVDLLHVLSGRYFERQEDAAGEIVYDEHQPRYELLLPPRRFRRETLDDPPRTVYAADAVDQTEWEARFSDLRDIAETWDLLAWQLAEWGALRIEHRFRDPYAAGGVRTTDPLEASRVAESRMRKFWNQRDQRRYWNSDRVPK